ncbi:hypothetical protein HX021_08755 [Sphingobacterium sp. N143]|uniref:hypothetical protein n=1 Tax=Sphingobacterium sp. N143 TaxID=2746727 RepID=UPI00257713E4|nr:hypothetical protein [Sphingobacterium sp. N143]MDM1294385.1 hypothetical protein [Sphingobacterium sp. N143]
MSTTRTITNDFLHYLQHRQLNELINLFANDVKWEVPGDVDHIRWLGTRNSKLEIQDLFNTLFFPAQRDGGLPEEHCYFFS